MKSEEERKISFKIRFVESSKPDSKPVNKLYNAKEADFSLDFLLSKCRLFFKQSKFSLQLLNNATNLDQLFFLNVIDKSRKGQQQQLIFVCQKGEQNEKEDGKSQQQMVNISKQSLQVLQKHESAKVAQKELPNYKLVSQKILLQSALVSASAISKQSAPLNQVEVLGSSRHTKSINPQPFEQGTPLNHDNKYSEHQKKQVQAILNSFKKRETSQEQLTNQILKLLQRYTYKAQDQIKIAKNITCQQCGMSNFQGPVYQCLICPGKVYLCRECQSKQELQNHPYRAHTLAKIKYFSQFIKKKDVTIVDCSDIPFPQSDDDSGKNVRKNVHQEKPSQIKSVNQAQIKNNPKVNQSKQTKRNEQKVKKIAQKPSVLQNRKKVLSALEKQKKRVRLKAFFNYTNDEVEKYMKGSYEHMSYQQVMKSIYKEE